MSEEEIEPVWGLPEQLPEGEHIVWQGRPRWRTLAREAFHVRKIGMYFGGLLVLRGLAMGYEHGTAAAGLWAMAEALPLALGALLLLYVLAYVNANAAAYTITNRRVVMRVGVALPMTFNLPFRCLNAADLKAYPDGDGEIALSLKGTDKLAYLHLWPHARPWKIAKSSPMLRAIPNAADVAKTLAKQVQGSVQGATA